MQCGQPVHVVLFCSVGDGRTVPQARHPPQTFHDWKQRFVESGKTGLSQSGKKDPIKTVKKREEDYKRQGTVKSRSAGPRHESQTWNRRCRALLFHGIVQ